MPSSNDNYSKSTGHKKESKTKSKKISVNNHPKETKSGAS